MNESHSRVYGLIGFPLIHSFSEQFFNQKFESEGIPARYANFEIADIGDLMAVIAANPDLGGLNVTIPYKEQIMSYLDDLDPMAARIGAVNVVKFIGDIPSGKFRMKGYNSDVIGFTDSIRPLLGPDRKAALVLGSGGASKAVVQALVDLGIDTTVVSRTPHDGMIGYDDITAEIMESHKIIVNTTPLGMYPEVNRCPDIPYGMLGSRHLCYDLLYNPDTTLFMKKSSEHGAEVKNGLEMLLLQAFVSWTIWNT